VAPCNFGSSHTAHGTSSTAIRRDRSKDTHRVTVSAGQSQDVRWVNGACGSTSSLASYRRYEHRSRLRQAWTCAREQSRDGWEPDRPRTVARSWPKRRVIYQGAEAGRSDRRRGKSLTQIRQWGTGKFSPPTEKYLRPHSRHGSPPEVGRPNGYWWTGAGSPASFVSPRSSRAHARTA
jgi:hypothetical protein